MKPFIITQVKLRHDLLCNIKFTRYLLPTAHSTVNKRAQHSTAELIHTHGHHESINGSIPSTSALQLITVTTCNDHRQPFHNYALHASHSDQFLLQIVAMYLRSKKAKMLYHHKQDRNHTPKNKKSI
jgi:hypothetical protein